VQHAAAASITLASELETLGNDHNVLVVFQTDAANNPGLVNPPFVNASGQREIHVTFDFTQLTALLAHPTIGAKIRNGGGATQDDVVGHEIHAHVWGFYRTDKTGGCPDKGYSSKTCSVSRENEIRQEMGHAPRTF
jgi:hypothetical protein